MFDRQRHCPQCGAEVSASARTCFMCGETLPTPRRRSLPTAISTVRNGGQRSCPHCGASISRTARVCTVCEQPVQPTRGRDRGEARREPPLDLSGAQASPSASHRRLERRCPTCGARIDEQADICPMCYTDLNRAALDQAIQGGAHPDPEGRPGAEATDAPAPAAPQARRPLSRVWFWGLAAAAIAAIVFFGSRVFQAAQPLGAEQSTPAATPASTTTFTPVSRAPTYTFTPTYTPTRAPLATPTPSPTHTPTATPAPTLTPTPRPTPTPAVHVVKAGETLYSIARLYAVDVLALSQTNGLTTASVLHPDDELVIPAPIDGEPLIVETPPGEAQHTVQEGEQLSDIAQRYSLSEGELREANELDAAAAVKPGDVLSIPLTNGPTPGAEPSPTATLTPGLPYPAPHLLYPLHNAEFRGPNDVVMLEWASVGILQEEDWYALSLRYLGHRADGQPSEITLYTRVTSWRVPEQWYPGTDAAEHRFDWTVQVVRRPDLAAPPTALSLPGELRRFTWL